MGFRELLGGTEGLLYYTAADDIFQLGSDKCSALARLNMLKLQYLVNISVNLNGHAILKFSCCDHI